MKLQTTSASGLLTHDERCYYADDSCDDECKR